MSVKLLTENHLEFLSLKGGCISSSEPTLVKMPHCWKSCVAAHMYILGKLTMPLVPKFLRNKSVLAIFVEGQLVTMSAKLFSTLTTCF